MIFNGGGFGVRSVRLGDVDGDGKPKDAAISYMRNKTMNFNIQKHIFNRCNKF
ncbi:MAG: hypothetical protein IPG02_05535 [Ignavibacteria bacterium]|nr:hypothetical protein [Ignavibacteria bacterium]